MKKSERIGAHVVIAVILGGHFAALALDREAWPFSPFPMYSQKRTEWVREAYALYGVPRVGAANEVPLESGAQLSPWGPDNLSNSFASLLAVDSARGRTTAALAGFLRDYERRRQRGEHHGPPLGVLRLYKTVTPLDPRAATAATPRKTELIAEVVEPDDARLE